MEILQRLRDNIRALLEQNASLQEANANLEQKIEQCSREHSDLLEKYQLLIDELEVANASVQRALDGERASVLGDLAKGAGSVASIDGTMKDSEKASMKEVHSNSDTNDTEASTKNSPSHKSSLVAALSDKATDEDLGPKLL